ncbi:metallophosphoesterase [Lichenihabitans sp. Uapishka_5]|uniref:metallophosphoesterase n=1 Tax=Lichenihabitans sp. Uapishka_5 TaxID=3037302 RepID=UPI0029E8211F|nr:metallophosphoesterase [Lichenihabitans sp. Uapishka_5]MDX7951692.1 metallophosphoesterase [Lichenihabitans sp. Uapishka_5]
MKLHVFSDLHLGFAGQWHPELAPGAEAVVCAGDVCEGLVEAMQLLRSHIPAPTPIITVAGNHSFYGRAMDDEWRRGRAAAQAAGITLLENAAAVIGGVRFVGTTLWTDYAVEGEAERGPAMERAAREMNDHRLIGWRAGTRDRFMPAHGLALHIDAVTALDALLAEPFAGPSVVVTHHAPSPRSILPRYRGHPLNPAFCSDLTDLIVRHAPVAWVHGHMHGSADYRIGPTRVINNPHGYGGENARHFNRTLILDTDVLA